MDSGNSENPGLSQVGSPNFAEMPPLGVSYLQKLKHVVTLTYSEKTDPDKDPPG